MKLWPPSGLEYDSRSATFRPALASWARYREHLANWAIIVFPADKVHLPYGYWV